MITLALLWWIGKIIEAPTLYYVLILISAFAKSIRFGIGFYE